MHFHTLYGTGDDIVVLATFEEFEPALGHFLDYVHMVGIEFLGTEWRLKADRAVRRYYEETGEAKWGVQFGAMRGVFAKCEGCANAHDN